MPDCFSSLPIAVLSTIHRLVHEAGGLRDALSLEATSMQLHTLFRCFTRFEQEVVLPGAALCRGTAATNTCWRWIAAHGARVDQLTFDSLVLDYHTRTFRALWQQPGVAMARAVTVYADQLHTFQPLAYLLNLVRLQSGSRVLRRSHAEEPPSIGRTIDLSCLQSVPGLKSLTLGDNFRVDATIDSYSLAFLSTLTSLTHLQLNTMKQDCSTVQFLTRLGRNLQSLALHDLPSITTLDPATALTNLTRLELRDCVGLFDGLAALSALQRLQYLSVAARPNIGMARPLDLMRHISSLLPLQSLTVDHCYILDVQPLSALHSTLRELRLIGCSLGPNSESTSEGLRAALGALRALRVLHVSGSNPCFKLPLDCLNSQMRTSLEQLELLCSSATTSLEPLGELVALQQLKIRCATHVSSLQPLSRLQDLQLLHLRSLASVSSLEPLSALIGLEDLCLKSMLRIGDLAPLRALTALQRLQILVCPLADKSTLGQQLLGMLAPSG
jgi:hypothetical protein